jgi:hypothetical protein
MKKPFKTVAVEPVEPLIRVIRGERVILDSDLARLYGVETKVLNRGMKRNTDRFPPDFVFQLSRSEMDSLRRPFGTLKPGRGQHRKDLPYAFREHGAIMATNVLNSPQAVRNRKSEIGNLQSSEVWPAGPAGTETAADRLPCYHRQ